MVAASTTEPLHEDEEAFALWLLASVPTIILSSLVAGYTLSRRALGPVEQLGQAIAGIGPAALDQRLPVSPRPDELDRLAAQFKGYWNGWSGLRRRTNGFWKRPPIRSALLSHSCSARPIWLWIGPGRRGHAEALRRIRIAAGQMHRRVQELLLLARAEAGERASLTERVELDGLALECADLMRPGPRPWDAGWS